jgi:hypothetical protein
MDKSFVVVRIEIEGFFVAFLRLPVPPDRFECQAEQTIDIGMGVLFP